MVALNIRIPDTALRSAMGPSESEKTTVECTGQDSTRPTLTKTTKIILVATLASAGFLNISSVQSCVILLPSISEDLNIPPARQQWVTSAYNIALGCALLFWGRVADIYGRRIIFLSGMAFITAITVSIPFSPNEATFDTLRALQGLGASATTPSAVGILSSSLPAGKQKNYGFITYTAASSLGSVVGNIIGGVIGSVTSWKWMFWITAIIAATIGGIASFAIPREVQQTDSLSIRHDLDIVGASLISLGLVLLLFVLSEGNTVQWSTPWVPVVLVVSVAIIAAFGLWQKHLERKGRRAPLVRLSLFRNLQFTAAFLIIMAYFSSFNSFLIFATFFYQDYQGLSTLQTTLRFLPAGIAGLLICFVTARIMHLTRGYFLLLFASFCGMISPLLFAVPIPPSTTYWAYGFPAMCLCISTDILAPTINLYVVKQLPQADQALGGALIQTSNQLGRAIGLAIATAVHNAVSHGRQGVGNDEFLHGIRAAEWMNFGMATAAFVIIAVSFHDLRESGPSPV